MVSYLWVRINIYRIVIESDIFVDDQEFNHYVEIVKEDAKLEDDNQVYKILPTVDKMLNHRKLS